MERRPDTTHTLVQTRNRLLGPLQLLPAGLLKDHGLLQNLARFHITDTDGLFAAIDVLAFDDRMLGWSGRHSDLDLGVFARKVGECFGQEGTVGWQVNTKNIWSSQTKQSGLYSHHAT